MLIALLLIVVILLLVAVTLLMRGKQRFSPMEFYARGKELGFTVNESNLIRRISALAGIADPTNVYWSIRDLDACIAAFSRKFKNEGIDRDRESLKFMDKLYEFRKKLEFEQPKYRVGMGTTRAIKVNQRIRVLIEGIGVFSSTVIDTNERYLVISYPVGGRLPPNFQWKGMRVSVYLWRQDDAGYVFDTYVLEDLRIRNIPVLQLGHSESLLRTQKRKSLRLKAATGAYLYLLKRLEGAYEKPERVPGLKCIVQDLSEDGAAVIIGGRAKVGLLVKLQLFMGDDQIVLSGTVRSAEYYIEKNQATLHIEAVRPSPRMRNIIRSHVYNVSGASSAVGNGPELDDSVFSG
ncbi:MAG: flagellar brake protein [Spirochaetota bacterium]